MLLWTFSEFAFNVLCSFIASILFLFFILFFLKPRIKISPVISYCIPEFETEYFYVIKFINRSFISAYDISLELYLVQTFAAPPAGNTNNRYTSLSFKLPNISHLPARPLFKNKTATHAIRFKTQEQLLELLTNPANAVEVRIKLKHGLSGLSKVYGYQYCDTSEIKEGKFAHGNSFDII